MVILKKKLDLWLLRHAKSSWSDPALPDIDRPLNNRGRNAAVTVSKFLNQLGFKADLALCSPSNRTQTTLNILNCNLVTPVPKKICTAIYEASVEGLIKILSNVPQSNESVLLVGHNPSLQNLALYLCRYADENSKENVKKIYKSFPTCGLVNIALPAREWCDIKAVWGQLRLVKFPKEITRDGGA